MSQDIQEILRALREYEDTPESRGLGLRLNLAKVVIRALKRKGWSQRDLASASSMKESFISRVLHSNANCTLDTAGRLFHALRVNAHITEVEAVGGSRRCHATAGEVQMLNREESCYAPDISTSEGATEERWQAEQASTTA
jgi:ribosome-binding protein aMBF1 (putative translation factor)